jgi:outer membrane protein
MSFHGRDLLRYVRRSFQASKTADIFIAITSRYYIIFSLIFALILSGGCVSDEVEQRGTLFHYQQTLANQGPQERIDADGRDMDQPLNLLKQAPLEKDIIPDVEIVTDPNTGRKVVNLTIEQVLARTLANSPEIRVVSFDPSIAQQDITKAASEFDITAFGELNFENEDNPKNSIYQSGQSDERTLETGIKQKSIIGSEWTLSYALTRSWDDLSGRTLSTRYEPILGFQLRQPLLRDAWQEVTLAGVDVAKMNYQIALLGFRQKAEDIATSVISAYWNHFQARENVEIYQRLLNRTLETLEKVEARQEIDATEVHIKQTEASIKAREAVLLQSRKRVIDAQDVLTRLMADPQLNVLNEFNIIPVSEPSQQMRELEISELLKIAMRRNPVIQQARIEIKIADINIRVAKNQDMPRLDLIGSARAQGLAGGPENAQERLTRGDYVSYGVGLSLEYPIGNRQREAELIQRRIERRKAVAVLQNVADQAAQLVRERTRRIKTNYEEIRIQQEAVDAAYIQLQVLEDTEEIRERLTPEFLLLKLQSQESLAAAQAAHVKAIVDFNIALAELAQTLGTVLELHQVEESLPTFSDSDITSE